MRIKKTLPLPTAPLDYFDDGVTFYLLMPARSATQVVAYDSDQFETLGTFHSEEQVFQTSQHVDNDCIFLITHSGVIGYDSFTGEKVVTFNTGSLLPLKMCAHDNKLYLLCGIPLVSGQAVDTDKVCISMHDQESGKKQLQSQSMVGESFAPVVNDGIWITVGNVLYKYSYDCELEFEISLRSVAGFEPIFVNDWVGVASDLGTIEFFEKDSGEPASKILVEKNCSPPMVHDGHLYWLTGQKIQKVDAQLSKYDTIYQLENDVVSTPLLHDGSLYFGDIKGNFIKYDILSQKHELLPVEDNIPLWKPVMASSGKIFVASHGSLHQIED